MRQHISLLQDTRKKLEKICDYHKLKMSTMITWLINKENRELFEGCMGNHKIKKEGE